jgi:hypothetical protein
MNDITTAPKRGRGRPATGCDPHFMFRAPSDLIAATCAAAARRGITVSAIGREALAAYLRNLGHAEVRAASKAA